MKNNINNELDHRVREVLEQSEVVTDPMHQLDDEVNPKSLLVKAYGLANEQFARIVGPHDVSTNAVMGDCRGLVGLLAKLAVPFSDIKCNDSFPYGFGDPISTSIYYPSDISNLEKLPVINFVGGILSNQGHYTEMITHWASYGFIVVISSNFINSTIAMHLLGFLSLSQMNRDPDSPVYGKVDLANSIVAGHSAGGHATLRAASLSDEVLAMVDPDIRISGALSIEPGPLAIGGTVKKPTLLLTGLADVVVPPFTWPSLWMLPLIKKVPAWGATALTATHFSPLRPLVDNEFAGITTAWLLYRAKGDASAKEYFVGENYKLAKDTQFIQNALNPLRVSRNALAENLS
ncbi:hypothetical protein AB7Z98_17225 [Providencia manganoxydans]|uniref:poly(ethylene terephthalate) hydrolase family protein n=1 Tax=Providencia manganoxydans TaxID=2923283 RepID=UPI0034E3D7F5